MRHIATLTACIGLTACSQVPADDEVLDLDGPKAVESLGPTDTTQSASEPVVEPVPAMCTVDEIPIFSCKVESGKQLSVCGQEGGGAQYRFGPAQAAELVIDAGSWASVPYSGGGEAQILFENGEINYIVFSRIVRTNFEPGEPNNPKISDGVMVYQDGEQIAAQLCDDLDVSPVNVEKAQDLLTRADGLFAEAN